MRTRDQQYAAAIFQQIEHDIEPQPRSHQKKYGSMAHKLPVLIRTAGLAQGLAFVESRGTEEHRLLLDHIAQVVGLTSRSELAERSRSTVELADYMLLTRKVLAALAWYKRFAQSVLKVESSDEGDEVDTAGGNQ
jgi:CRISPR-associated protein Cmr5